MSSVRRLLSRSSSAFLAMLLLLVVSTGMVMAQGSSDTGDMSVTVLPAGSPAPAPGEPPAAPGPPLTTDDPGPSGVSDAPGMPGEASAGLGTVSAWVVYHEPVSGFPDQGETPTLLIVRDDRGTARGWAVTMSASGPDGTAWMPFLIENAPGTLLRILPAGSLPILDGEVEVGRTLGPLEGAVRILEARPGGGAGLFRQVLGVIYPDADVNQIRIIFVHISSGP